MKVPMNKLPHHIACIMDGNGRWAKLRGKPRIAGHQAGSEAVSRCIDLCIKNHIPYLTLYAFSTENWNRPKVEVQALMTLLHRFLSEKMDLLHEKKVRLSTIGDTARLPNKTQVLLRKAIEDSKDYKELHLVLALSYGSRDEIIHAAQQLAMQVKDGMIEPSDITADLFEQQLHTKDIPDPDLLIRTSGEMRISNFLLWQISYTELYVTPTLWPDFNETDFNMAIEEFASRHRKFGKL